MKRMMLGLVLAVLWAPPAQAAVVKPQVVGAPSRAPNANGWYRAPVSATLSVTGLKTVDQCTQGVVFTDANNKLAAAQYKRYITYPATKCRVTGSIDRSGITDVSLRAVAGKWTQTKHVLLRFDDGAPSISISAPQVPVVVHPLTLLGTVADTYSGPDAVTLHFSDPAGVQPSFDAKADCMGCGTFHACSSACGFATQWNYKGSPPTGVWAVSAAATDLAGNTTISDPVTIVVI